MCSHATTLCCMVLASNVLKILGSPLQAKGKNWQTVSMDNGGVWTTPAGVDLGKYNGTSVGPGRGLQLSKDSPAPGRLLFIGHHGPYEVKRVFKDLLFHKVIANACKEQCDRSLCNPRTSLC